MKDLKGFVLLSLLLVFLSALLYFAHYMIFHDPHHIFIYLVGDIAFVPVEVLMVTLILHRLLEHRERKSRMQKLNMVIGVFFTEMGGEMLARLSALDRQKEGYGALFASLRDWDDGRYEQVLASLGGIRPQVRLDRGDLSDIKAFLCDKKEVLVRLLENPNLLEHETFTELLWAATHVVEELGARRDLAAAPDSDIAHLNGDVNRAYGILVREWVHYLRHLRSQYPFLYSFAVRTNPFDAAARITVA